MKVNRHRCAFLEFSDRHRFSAAQELRGRFPNQLLGAIPLQAGQCQCAFLEVNRLNGRHELRVLAPYAPKRRCRRSNRRSIKKC